MAVLAYFAEVVKQGLKILFSKHLSASFEAIRPIVSHEWIACKKLDKNQFILSADRALDFFVRVTISYLLSV